MRSASLEHVAVATCQHLRLLDAKVALRPRYMNYIVARKIETCCDHGLSCRQLAVPSFLLQLSMASDSKSWARSTMDYIIDAAVVKLKAAQAFLIGGVHD